MADVLIESRNLHAGYRGQAVVHDINLSVNAGEIVCLFGPNAAGKTTTVLTLAGELPAISGATYLFGRETNSPLYQRVPGGTEPDHR